MNTKKTRANRKINMTDSRCKALAGPDPDSTQKGIEYTDTRVEGLKLLASRTAGKKTWYYRYTWRDEKPVIKIGDFPGIGVEEARRIAIAFGAQVDRGEDPRAEKKARSAMPTLEEFAKGDYTRYASAHKRSFADDEAKLRMYILPKLGRKLMCDITRQDVDMHRTEIAKSHTPATANRHLSLLKRMLSLAVEWDILKVNPAAGLKTQREPEGKDEFLGPDLLAKLLAALDQEENTVAASALKVLLFTGCRREEIAQARWADLDPDTEALRLPKTKSGKAQRVPLNEAAIKVLDDLPPSDSEWIFPGRDPSRPIVNLTKPFKRALKVAGLPQSFRIHDLRHAFGSNAVSAGVPLYQLQKLLRHSSPQMTQRYAHLAGSALRDASAIAAQAMLGAVQHQTK